MAFIIVNRTDNTYYTGIKNNKFVPFKEAAKKYHDSHSAGCAVSRLKTPNVAYIDESEVTNGQT